MSTKICEYCDQEIGENEKKCPKCNVDFEETEEIVSTVGRALTVIEKRRAKEAEAKKKAEAEEAAKNPPKKKGSALLRGFGRG